MTSATWLELSRTVRFSDTDAAGVMHFQQLLGWCHQAWEESLERFGLPAGSVFPGGRGEQPSVALPIVHCHACLLYTSPSPRDATLSRMPSSA